MKLAIIGLLMLGFAITPANIEQSSAKSSSLKVHNSVDSFLCKGNSDLDHDTFYLYFSYDYLATSNLYVDSVSILTVTNSKGDFEEFKFQIQYFGDTIFVETTQERRLFVILSDKYVDSAFSGNVIGRFGNNVVLEEYSFNLKRQDYKYQIYTGLTNGISHVPFIYRIIGYRNSGISVLQYYDGNKTCTCRRM